MTKYLLAAEADRIQDLLFRSSQLREVVGGSQLLKRFGDGDGQVGLQASMGKSGSRLLKQFGNDVPTLLANALGLELGTDVEVITKGGGSFYLEFAQEDVARRFGAVLAEAYYRSTGGTLSVIEPVAYSGNDADYPDASEKAGARLRAAKRGGSFVAVTQIPYVAFCESCGVGLAEAHEKRFEEDEAQEGHYLCRSCRLKTAERVDQNLGQFLKPFYARIVKPELLTDKHKMDWPQDADSVGRLDPRNYVAYLVADGNGMGDVFHECSKAQAKILSDKMDEVLQISLARPLKTFLKAPAGNMIQQFMPVLPLILGGDDLFALIPAPWALDIAGRLCLHFQQEMTKFARDQGILEGDKDITMTAVVVICKANYPYYLAHEIGEERLGQAKRVVKALAKDEKRYLSAVDFEVILGSQVEPVTHDKDADYLATLRPYWVLPDDADAAPPPSEWGLPLDSLLEQRLTLAAVNLPARRRSQLRELLDQIPAKGDSGTWDEALSRLLARVERDRRRRGRHPLRQALEELGGVKLSKWQEVTRTSDRRSWQGNGMGDLLRVWDWAFQIDEDPIKYEGGQA